jgi:diguanylate cyclase (GGDEF)-like protein
MAQSSDQNSARQGVLRKYLIHIGTRFSATSSDVHSAIVNIKQRLRANPRDPRLDDGFEDLYKAIIAVELPARTGSDVPKTLVRFLDKLTIPDHLTSAALRLSSRLQRTSKPDSLLLDDYAKLLNQCMEAKWQGKVPRTKTGPAAADASAVERLLSGLSDECELNRRIQDAMVRLAGLNDKRAAFAEIDRLAGELRSRLGNDQGPSELDQLKVPLGQLLGAVDVSGEAAARTQKLRRKLEACLSMEDYDELSADIAALVAHTQSTLRREIDELAKFLATLNTRLDELSESLVELGKLHDSADQSHRDLDDSVRREVRNLNEEVSKTQSIVELKATIEAGLTGLEERIQGFVMEELERTQHTVKAAERLQQKVSSLETETQQLKVKIEQETTRSLTDILTGIPNRLAYAERAEQEFQRWQRYGGALSLILFDIDHFKRINDALGHDVGDRALRAVAQALKSQARSVDFVARFGGEEFVVLLPNTELTQAHCAAEKLRTAIDSLLFKHIDKEVPVTVSAGVAALEPDDDFDTVVKRADQALYRAKRNGRNRCEVESTRSAA